MISASSEGNSM